MSDSKNISPLAKKSAARLAAVQALYQMQKNNQKSDEVIKEYIDHRQGMDVEGEAMVPFDAPLFSKIVGGAADKLSDIKETIAHHLDASKSKQMELLLESILIAGAYELLAHEDIDGGIIINDYVNVTHAFYDKKEAGLVNALLDKIIKVIRL